MARRLNNHQGVAAQAEALAVCGLEDLFQRAEEKHEAPFFFCLDGIEDPHNLGSILRSADASGAHGVVIPNGGRQASLPTVAKTSAGAVEHVPVVRVTNLNRDGRRIEETGSLASRR